MTFSRKEQWIIFLTVNAILLLAVGLFPIYDEYIRLLPTNRCNLVALAHLYCPACGGTRAFKALCELDILRSFVYNPIVPVGAIIGIIYEAVMIKYLIRGGERPLLIKTWMVLTLLGAWLAYCILRNVLLFYGIDLLGDIIH